MANDEVEDSVSLPGPEVLQLGSSWELIYSKFLKPGKHLQLNAKIAELRLCTADSQSPTTVQVCTSRKGYLSELNYSNHATITNSDAGRPLCKLVPHWQCKHQVVVDQLCADCGQIVNSLDNKNEPSPNFIRLGFMNSDSDIQVTRHVSII